MLGSAVNDTIREQMAALKREYNRSHVTISSTGSANAYVLTYTTAPPAYVHGMRFAFKANFTNTGAATVNVNSLGAKSIVRGDGATSPAANDIVVNQHVHLEYDSALDKMVMLTVPGTTVTTGANTFAGDQTITAGAINTARATVASAATTADIWAADGNQIDWTGTTTCTGFPAAPQAGVERVLICAGAAPFTAGANMLIDGVSSGNTVTCAANDIMIVRAVTTTQFRLSRVKYDGTSQVSASDWKLLSTYTASASTTIDVQTGFSSTYNNYVIIGVGVTPVTDNVSFQCQLRVAGVFKTDANYRYHLNKSASNAVGYVGAVGTSVTAIDISSEADNTFTSPINFVMQIYNVNDTALRKTVTWQGVNYDGNAGVLYTASGVGSHTDNAEVSGVRFLMSSGNISTGTFYLYGLAK